MNDKKRKGGNGAPPAFEDALARLEKIVQELEGQDLTLEETLARYEEGSGLVRECTRRLEEAEQRIRVLSVASEGAAGGTGGRARAGSAAAGDVEGDEEEAGDDDGDEEEGDDADDRLPF